MGVRSRLPLVLLLGHELLDLGRETVHPTVDLLQRRVHLPRQRCRLVVCQQPTDSSQQRPRVWWERAGLQGRTERGGAVVDPLRQLARRLVQLGVELRDPLPQLRRLLQRGAPHIRRLRHRPIERVRHGFHLAVRLRQAGLEAGGERVRELRQVQLPLLRLRHARLELLPQPLAVGDPRSLLEARLQRSARRRGAGVQALLRVAELHRDLLHLALHLLLHALLQLLQQVVRVLRAAAARRVSTRGGWASAAVGWAAGRARAPRWASCPPASPSPRAARWPSPSSPGPAS